MVVEKDGRVVGWKGGGRRGRVKDGWKGEAWVERWSMGGMVGDGWDGY